MRTRIAAVFPPQVPHARPSLRCLVLPAAPRSLAQACWASEPRSRPTAAALVTVLQRLLTACAAQQPGAGAGAGMAHIASR